MRKIKIRRSIFSLANISIQYRLPVLISILLIFIILIFAGASYYGIRKNNLEIGYERLNAISDQFANSLSASNIKNNQAFFNLSQHNEIKKFLSSGKTDSEKKLSEVLNTYVLPGDSLLLRVQILDKNKKPVFISLNKTNIKLNIDSVLKESLTMPDNAATGKFYSVNDSIVWPWVSAVVENDEVIGYVYRLKYLKISEETLNTFAKLLGANTTFYFANDDGSIWTNLLTEVSPPPVYTNMSGIMDYVNAEGEDVIAKLSDIKGVPWSILIERSKDATLTTAARYLEIMGAIGVILLVTGIFLAWFMSRNITEPLNKLSVAADGISNGNYSNLVDIEQKDELGKLADSFNSMVIKIKDSQLELEQKVKDRTSELRKANLELEDLNKKLQEMDELKTSFFTNVSHELRTPLSLILGPVEKLLSGNNLYVNAEKDLRIIQQNARILLKQVNNLLDLSKLEVGKMEIEYSEIDLANLLRIIASYFEAFALEKKITLKVNAPGSLFVQVDVDKIERIIINLLSNAFKFTPENGEIICSLKTVNDYALLSVKDTGPGIKPELQKEIFSKYKRGEKGLTRHLGSTGLGLSIVKEFVELHNGTIELNSDNEGADFLIKIPVTAPAGSILQGRKIITENEINDTIESFEILHKKNEERNLIYNLKSNSKSKNESGSLILVIEDNYNLNAFIEQSLNDTYNIITAFDGEEGFEKALKYKPDLIITDIMMPKLPGDMVVSKIKSIPELEHTPIIVLSAKSDDETKINLLKQGVQDYLNKPFTIEELKARINNIIKVKIVKDRLQRELKSHNEDITSLVEELTDRKKFIELSLKEKEVLLKEIHHRVKNNLQVISSLLNLQSGSIKDQEAYEVFRESQNRIKSMALIHEKLYKSKNLFQINLEEYINDLITNLCSSYSFGKQSPSIKLQIKKVLMNIDSAISLGLIINELISNSLKHAFNGNIENHEVHVLLSSLNKDQYCLIVRDNGRGLPDNYDYKNPQTLGLRLVYSLVSQLEGDLQIFNNNGVEFKINFTAKETA